MRESWIAGHVIIWQRVAALSRTLTFQPQIFPPFPLPLLQMLSLHGEQTQRWWERCFRHILVLKAPGSVIFRFFPSPSCIPNSFCLYLHVDPVGWNTETHSDVFEVQDRWEAPGTVKNESRVVIGEMFWILSPISYLSGALSGGGRLQSAPLM